MTIDFGRARQLLRNFDFRSFIRGRVGLGRHNATLNIAVLDSQICLSALAEKRGMVAYHCPTSPDEPLPKYAQRRKMERQVVRKCHDTLSFLPTQPRPRRFGNG